MPVKPGETDTTRFANPSLPTDTPTHSYTMSFYWREAGISYLQYANISAKALRNVLKEQAKIQALRREEQFAKVQIWKDGKQGDSKVIDPAGNKLNI
ncbi:mitochondrial ATP synthase epsilon chain-domain-containing protein [Powellomyces hirtus]|nr:mitochondrial ATP synthase epsilon chain-domain-containing protein [Powellomyces hirtus]